MDLCKFSLRREVDASSTSPAAPIYETLAGGSLHIAISVPARTRPKDGPNERFLTDRPAPAHVVYVIIDTHDCRN